jgi:hypothetical protein
VRPDGRLVRPDRRFAQEWEPEVLQQIPAFVLPAHAVASGWLDQIGPVGPRALPIGLAAPIKEAIAAGEPVYCWITGQQIQTLHFDHVIPWSYGGANLPANLLPAEAAANCTRGNSLELLRERQIGWRWDLDQHGVRVRVPDSSQRLVRVLSPEGEVQYWSVPKFNSGELAVGVAGAAVLALAIEGGLQWRRGEFRTDDLAEEAAKGAAAYAARYSAKVALETLAPRAITLGVTPAGVEMLGSFAGPVGFIAAIYAAEAIEQSVALARRKVTPRMAAREFALAPIGAVKDTAELAVSGYKLISPKHRAIRKTRQKFRSVNFIADLKRPAPDEGLALAT